jgi:glycosyltransferase involved in cell wall biosynthesis
MRIIFILPCTDLSGGNRVIATYASRLRSRGHDVLAVVPARKPFGLKQQVRSLLQGKGLFFWPKHQTSHFDQFDVPLLRLDHAGPVGEADLPDSDVVIATWWETAEWVAKLPPAKGVKVYFVQHHEVFDYLPVERVKATYRLPLHKITISKWLASMLEKEYGDHHVCLVPNSVDTQQFYAPPRVKQSTPTVGLLYEIAPWKGCDVSFAALSRVSEAIPDLRVIAFGTASLSSSLPLPTNFRYIQQPAQNQIKDIYASCDVWLCGSRSEGFHLPPLEAMACRCPVVSTAVGGPIDVIKDGINGYIVPVEDADLLAKQLIHVLQLSQEQWQNMSDAAYETAKQYTWDDATELFEQVLKTAITRKKEIDSEI